MTKGDKIRKLREKCGFTQEELAEKIGTSKQNIYKYEKNIITNIPIDKIEALAKVFNVTPGYLMGWGRELDDLDWKVHELYPDFNPKDGYISDQVPTTQKPKLRSLSRLEYSDFTPEEDEQILDFINYIKSKRKGE